ncbi:N-formylglutamate amidohydrolase [Altericroceibacterium spongiae]|uniref:N-formylglutamate amidohydrolase n=1 Tax=Altericroceibacterium spongiae TaxID=2320269 RepID=A0A420ERC2_9SPHN|nr:N-formylglutamate amidohydrolase [Altericroceibacterium spongiae]RKF23229.1 N-formylglutamate amidohydrolase [Altericroceibacterium spongiae]
MSESPFKQIGTPQKGDIVAICDHASNHVPADIDLGIGPELLEKHIAYDIGTEGVVDRLAVRHHVPVHHALVSRLVIDLHREEDSPGLIPETSDGHLIPGNLGADREGRIARFYKPYHEAFARWIAPAEPRLLLSIHSFTPDLESKAEDRPWEVGLLYNEDDRAARHAIRMFAQQGCVVGDNEPYSGKLLNATMNRHAEAHGIPYLAIEIRNDLIAHETGQSRWAAMIHDIAGRVALALD